ncbi:hypothetical protein HYT32_00820 [Candidatus Roizmanbacteria bacterium]|nr:hypothetical protein [Candidatus Roizmanbacteria bacterium]
MSKISRVTAATLLLLHKPSYIILTGVLSIFLFVLYFILNNFSVFTSIVAVSSDPAILWKVFVNQVEMVWEIAGPINVLAVALVSFLAGINLSLVVLRTRATKVFVGRTNVFGFFGIFGGAFGAACSACNTALIGLLGVSGGLAIFPLRGLEFSFLALLLLILSLYYISKSMFEMGVIK